ncbi:hypothetical protein E4656_18250 [Natronospirillum operosum]|uniref:Uncharacterized protein n=1 Tax=Natronospirillum operosum TaxID=2759953 RepID=A0A4Z0W6N6_9GAMM|nr:hypothetical protein [Natronospirillum operosum]TGG90664.1 hypothetical protein E4656_18250 [Natronospirillum operosum]
MVTSCARWTRCWSGELIARVRHPMPARVAARQVAPEIAVRRGGSLIVAHRPMPALIKVHRLKGAHRPMPALKAARPDNRRALAAGFPTGQAV